MKKNLVMLVLLVGSVQLGASGKSGALGSRHTCLCPIREALPMLSAKSSSNHYI